MIFCGFLSNKNGMDFFWQKKYVLVDNGPASFSTFVLGEARIFGPAWERLLSCNWGCDFCPFWQQVIFLEEHERILEALLKARPKNRGKIPENIKYVKKSTKKSKNPQKVQKSTKKFKNPQKVQKSTKSQKIYKTPKIHKKVQKSTKNPKIHKKSKNLQNSKNPQKSPKIHKKSKNSQKNPTIHKKFPKIHKKMAVIFGHFGKKSFFGRT